MSEEQLDLVRRAPAQRLGERARLDHIARQVDVAEGGGQTAERAILVLLGLEFGGEGELLAVQIRRLVVPVVPVARELARPAKRAGLRQAQA